MEMAINTKENGDATMPMAKVPSLESMGLFTKVNGETIFSMEKESKGGPRGSSSKGSLKRARRMARVDISLLKGMFILESLGRIDLRVTGSSFGRMEMFTKGSGRTI